MRSTAQTRRALASLLIGTGLLVGCTMNGPSNLKIHEVNLSGGANETLAWVYGSLSGPSSNLKLGSTGVEVRAQVQDALATPGSLSVNGQAVFKVAAAPTSQKLSVTRTTSGEFDVTVLNDASIAAVYYTDGQNWWKLTGTSGTALGIPSAGLRGAGQLTDDEGDALGRALSGQGNMAVAVMNDPRAPLNVEPKPSEYLQTSLYLLPGIQTVSSTTTGTVTMTPSTPTPSTPGGNPNSFSEVARGSNARAESFTVMLANTAAEVREIYAVAYGRQSSMPNPMTLRNETLVAIFMGQRSTGGYSIEVQNVQGSGNSLTVTVTLKAPGAGMLTTQALTSPWVMLKVPGQYSSVNVVDASGQPIR